jgi:glycosyltransferase involved in cell wall biosynthesis
VRICIVYDHLFPQTVGGTERWLRDLAVRLAALNHDVTYLTMRHWSADDAPALPGVRVVGLTEPGRVYTSERRTYGPPLRFGIAVAQHLARHGGEYDVVHTAAFPYFPLLAAAAFRRRGRYRIFVDWIEVWTWAYWRRYAGPIRGTIGWLVQFLCMRIPQQAFSMSHLHAQRYAGAATVLPGLYDGPCRPSTGVQLDRSLVVYAGRFVREKRVDALVRGFAEARGRRSDLRLELYGDGPLQRDVERLTEELGIAKSVRIDGRRPEEEVGAALARAACVATASEREGYGLVVVEAAARGTPCVVVAGPENATTELVHEGVNGAIARDASPKELAAALLRVVCAGSSLRASTSQWFGENAHILTLERSLETLLQSYGETRESLARRT